MDKKSVFILVAAIVMGLSIAFYAWSKMDSTQEPDVKVLVPTHDITPYSTIQDSDLKVRVLKESEVDDHTVLELNQVRNKVPTVALYANKPIDKRNLQPTINAEDKRIVGVLIDTTRLGSATAGDYVDVYWVNAHQGDATALSPALTLTRKAQIIAIEGDTGNKSLTSEQKVTSDGKVKAVYLLVNPGDVSHIIQGSMQNNIALAKILNPQAAESSQIETEASQMAIEEVE